MTTHHFKVYESEFEMLADGRKNFSGFMATVVDGRANATGQVSPGDNIVFSCEGVTVTRVVSGIFFEGSDNERYRDSGIGEGRVIVQFREEGPPGTDHHSVFLAREMFRAEAKATIAFAQYLESNHPDDLKTWLEFDLGRERASESARAAILGKRGA